MILYNVTINIDNEVADEWLEWMKRVHIPEMLATGKFTKALMSKVMVTEPMGGITYSIQYTTESRDMLQRYYEEDATLLRSKTKIFDGKFVAFRTEMQVVSELDQ